MQNACCLARSWLRPGWVRCQALTTQLCGVQNGVPSDGDQTLGVIVHPGAAAGQQLSPTTRTALEVTSKVVVSTSGHPTVTATTSNAEVAVRSVAGVAATPEDERIHDATPRVQHLLLAILTDRHGSPPDRHPRHDDGQAHHPRPRSAAGCGRSRPPSRRPARLDRPVISDERPGRPFTCAGLFSVGTLTADARVRPREPG